MTNERDALEHSHSVQAVQIDDLRRKMGLMERAEEIRVMDHSQAIEYVVEELNNLNRQLKGDSLSLVIQKITDIYHGQEKGNLISADWQQ